MARRVSCSQKNPLTTDKLQKLRRGGYRLIVMHEDIAYSEKDQGYFCLNCNDGPLGRAELEQ